MFHRYFSRRNDGSQSEAGVAMIIAITVVMLLTLITLTIYTQAIQQLPIARHDQDHEAALHSAEALALAACSDSVSPASRAASAVQPATSGDAAPGSSFMSEGWGISLER